MMSSIAKTNAGAMQVRAARHDGWTAKRRAGFLDVLATTCNVSRAAAAVGMSTAGARLLRARDGEFSRLWEEALAQAYHRLEDELLARALGQVRDVDNPGQDRGDPEGGTEAGSDAGTEAKTGAGTGAFDPVLAMNILKMRDGAGRGRAKKAPPRATQAEVDAELMKRLDEIARRLEKREARA
jgi:hypothetical protein